MIFCVCFLPTIVFSLLSAGCNTFTASSTGFAFIEIQPDFFSSGSVTVIADTGIRCHSISLEGEPVNMVIPDERESSVDRIRFLDGWGG